MRLVLLAVCLTAATAIAQDDPFKSGVDLQAEVAKDCAEGCITLNHQQAEDFEARLSILIEKKMKEAFAAGVAYQKAACRSLI